MTFREIENHFTICLGTQCVFSVRSHPSHDLISPLSCFPWRHEPFTSNLLFTVYVKYNYNFHVFIRFPVCDQCKGGSLDRCEAAGSIELTWESVPTLIHASGGRLMFVS